MDRLLFTGDTHLGYRQYRSSERRDDFLDAFSQVVDVAQDRDVDAVVHGGDLFHSRDPGLETQLDAAEQIDRLSVPFLGIVGNHERKRDRQFLDLLAMTTDSARRLDGQPWHGEDTTVMGWDHVPPSRWDTTDWVFPTVDRVRIGVVHQLLSPIVPDLYDPQSGTELVEQMGDPDLVVGGDYHGRTTQRVAGTRIHYPGSTERTSRREPADKWVSIVEIEDGDLDIRRVGIDTRPFVETEISLGPDRPVRYQVRRVVRRHDLEDAVVHVSLQGQDVEASPRSLEEMIRSLGALVAQVDDDRTIELDVQAVDHDSQDIESAVDEMIDDAEISETVSEINAVVRDDDVQKTNVRSEVREILDESGV